VLSPGSRSRPRACHGCRCRGHSAGSLCSWTGRASTRGTHSRRRDRANGAQRAAAADAGRGTAGRPTAGLGSQPASAEGSSSRGALSLSCSLSFLLALIQTASPSLELRSANSNRKASVQKETFQPLIKATGFGNSYGQSQASLWLALQAVSFSHERSNSCVDKIKERELRKNTKKIKPRQTTKPKIHFLHLSLPKSSIQSS
jgi:hypothetical protein